MTQIYKRLLFKCLRDAKSCSPTLGALPAYFHLKQLFSLLFLLGSTMWLQAQTFPVEIETLPPGKKIIITYKAKIVKPLDPRTTLTVSDQAFLSADGLDMVRSNDPDTPDADDATVTSVLGCTIQNITAATPICGNDNQFSVDIAVTQTGDAPITGNLVLEVGAQTFETPVQPDQTTQLISIALPANGDTLDVRAYYSELPACELLVENLLIAPRGCGIIGNRVWEDLNGDGIQNDGSGGIPNVSVSLLDCNDQPITQTLTDANGVYQFTQLPPGTYKVRFNLSTAAPIFASAVFSTPNAAEDDFDSDVNPMTKETPCFDLLAGEQNFNWDAGLYVPGQIGNFAWIDNNRNNVFNNGTDAPLSGLPVRLFLCSDTINTTPIATQITGANGAYLFSNLKPGSYKVKFEAPTTGIYERVTPNIGNDEIDSDANFSGFTDCYSIQSRQQDLTVDAGYTFCPPGINMVCRGSINVSMGPSCEVIVTPDMLLTVAPPCESTYEVRIRGLDGRNIGNTLTSANVGQTLQATVIDKQTGNSCATNITIFDQRKPEITCPPNTNKAQYGQQVQLITGTLSTLLSSVNLSTFSCFQPIVNPGGGNHFFELYEFTVSADDIYTLELSPQFGEGGALLFIGEVDASRLKCENLIAQSYKSFTSGIFFTELNPITRITQQLSPGQTYTLVTTSRVPGAIGAYFWAAYSDGDGLISGLQPIATQASYDLICNDINQILNNPQSLAFVGSPIAVDNCQNPVANVTFTDVLTEGNECTGDIIARKFRATDPSGNFAECTQLISVRKPTLADVIYPRLTVFLECDSDFEVDINGNPHPDATGYPIVKTSFGNHQLRTSYCNMTATYVDKPRSTGCAETFGFIRDWTIVDFCNTGNILTFSQVIRVGDGMPPTVSCPTADNDNDGVLDTLVFSTANFACTATFNVPAPIISDNCSSSTFTVEILSDTLALIRDEFGFIIGEEIQTIVRATVQSTASLQVSNIPIGIHRFRYIVRDACGNETTLECPFKVEDLIEPVVVCQNNLTISLGGNGTARIFATDVDEGSRDNCGIDSILIRRRFTKNPMSCDSVGAYFSPWTSFVDIGCCDVGAPVYVELRVTDKAGNFNECIVDVVVNDMIRPFCVAPAPVSITCTALPEMFNPNDTMQLRQLFGVATPTDNCSASWEELTPTVNLDDCNVGNIVRRFRTTDKFGNVSVNTCQQVITITKVNHYTIKFPKDTDVQCGQPVIDSLQVNLLGCDQVSISVTEDPFSSIGDECYRIFRTYRVINWCEYDGSSPPVVIGRDEDCDNRAGDEDVWVIRRPNNIYVDRNDNETDNIPAVNQRGCTPNNPKGYWRTTSSLGYWQYTQILRVKDTIAPTVMFVPPTPFCSNSINCNATVTVPFVITEACTPNAVTLEVTVDIDDDGVSNGTLANFGAARTGVYPNFQVSGTNFPLGKHAFLVRVVDGCNNQQTQRIPFEVVDCRAPMPTCVNSLTVNPLPVKPARDVDGDGDVERGAITVKVNQLISAMSADCTGPVRFSVNKMGELPNIDRDSIIITCDDIGTTVFVEVYAWDSAANPYSVQPNGTVGGPNYSFCATSIVVIDTLKACAPPNQGLVTGIVKTENNNTVEAVKVALSGQSAANTATGLDGKYTFAQLEEGNDYTVTPLLDEKHRNGVTTIDLVIITKHILGVEPLDSPYKMLAADVNGSKGISILDLIEMRKLILGISVAFPGNTSWRFVQSAYNFPVQSNPWFEEFPEVMSLNNLTGSVTDANFVAVKIGDTNLSANTAQEGLIHAEPRSNAGTFALEVKDRQLIAGKIYEIDLTAELTNIQGYQLTFAFDPQKLEFQHIKDGLATAENFGLQAAPEGLVSTSWHKFTPEQNASFGKKRMFSFVFLAKQDAQLSDLLRVSSRITTAEAYNNADEEMDVAIQFDGGAVVNGQFELYQNVPNPFADKTVIGFYLPEPMTATLSIHDVGGKILKTIEGTFSKGTQQIEIERVSLPTGVLYYTLKAEKYVATRKMILLK